jgi:dTDP-4-dehydrorhamnose 3,5-epimerase
MKLQATPIPGLFIAETALSEDRRGGFARLFCERDLEAAVAGRKIVQINLSRTAARGAVRGMHYQHPPHAEMKLIRCLHGAVFDVVVDLRPDSPTYLKWHAEELRPESAKMMVIPEGCAHGFQALEPDSELLYLHTAFYTPEAEGGVRHDDPAFAIAWPMPVTEISDRDLQHPPVGPEFKGIDA